MPPVRVNIMSVKQVINIDPGEPLQSSLVPPGGTCHITIASVSANALSSDQTEVMDPSALMHCVDEEVARFCASSQLPENFSREEPNRRELLGVLTFAYARRVFESEEIANRCQTDTTFQRLCNGHSPFASELIRFRRHYRPLLVTLLANVLMRTSEAALKGTTLSSSAALKRQLLCQATARLDTARHLDSGSE